MKILIVHHIEFYFQDHLDIIEWLVAASKHFQENSYDKIIWNTCDLEYHDSDEHIEQFLKNNCKEFVHEHISWGYEIYSFDEEKEGIDFIALDYSASSHWPIPEWFKDISLKDDVYIAGCFDQECVNELRAFLDKVSISFFETELVY